MTAAATIALALAAAQTPSARDAIDPFLTEELRPVVAEAIEAELDDKRGPANAVAALEKKRAELAGRPDAALSLQLRVAAIELRKLFLASTQFPIPIRYEQCLSTFGRLDLADPGLEAWVERTLENHPYARSKLAKKQQRVVKASLLVRGTELDKKAIEKRFVEAVGHAGFRLAFVPAKQASMILKIGAESAPSPDPTRRAVRVTLGLESLRDGKLIWRHALFRTESAKDATVALDAALDWLARIGGRDMLFRWMGERAFHTFVQPGRVSVATGEDLERDPHEGHDHAGHGFFGDVPVPGTPKRKSKAH